MATPNSVGSPAPTLASAEHDHGALGGLARRSPDAGAPSREQLLDAALDAFAEHGYGGTSIREVARAVGVHHNHYPQRFGTKERLWYAAVDHGFSQIRADLLPVLAEAHPDQLTRLRAVMVRFVEANARRPAVLRILNQEAITGGPRLDYIAQHYITPVFTATSALLDALHARGEVRSNSAGLLYFFVTNGSAGGPILYPLLAEHVGMSIDPEDCAAVHDHAVAAVDLFFGGLVTD